MSAFSRLRWPHILLLSVVFLIGVGAIYSAFTFMMADFKSMRSRWQIEQWQKNPRRPPSVPDMGRAGNDLLAALAWTPKDPQLYEGLAFVHALRASRLSMLPDVQQALFDEAIVNYRQALRLRPMSAHAWSNLALALHYRQNDEAGLWQAFDQAYRFGQREGRVQLLLAQIALARWDALGDVRQQQVRQIFSEARGKTRKALLKLAEAAERRDLLPEN